MIRGTIWSWLGLLVIGTALVATTSDRAEAATIDGGFGTVVLRGANSESEPSGPTGNGAPIVLRGSPPPHSRAAPERSACGDGYYYDPNRGCLAPETAYSPDYGYWAPYGWGWPFFDFRHRQTRHSFSHHRFQGQAIRFARHHANGFGFGRGFSHR
jgi:hypothetical protein